MSFMAQMTLNFQPTLPERFPSLRAFVAHRSTAVDKSQKTQAADMDLAPSMLSRKLNPSDGDTQRFNCDDLEAWLESTKDAAAVIEYLAAKFMDTPDARKARTLLRLESLANELADALATVKAGV